MLKVFFGNDVIGVRGAAIKAVQEIVEQGYVSEIIDPDNFAPNIFASATEGVSLFGDKKVYLVDTPSLLSEMYEATVSSLDSFATSVHLFIIIEGPLLAPEKKKFAKFAGAMEEFKAVADERFNSFALADALAQKDKKSLWLLLHQALLSGIALEELIGTLWWQLKTLRLATLTNSATEAGLKDYPYNKAKRALGKFQAGEIENLSHSLLRLQHDSRLGKRDLDLALERFVLTL